VLTLSWLPTYLSLNINAENGVKGPNIVLAGANLQQPVPARAVQSLKPTSTSPTPISRPRRQRREATSPVPAESKGVAMPTLGELPAWPR
jgi:hypothetical protein